jgi:hypothetical protein
VIVVFSDDESNRFYMNAVGAAFRHPPAVQPIYVHVWNPDDRVYLGKQPDPQYSPDLSSAETAAQLASATGGRVYEEAQFDSLVAGVRSAVGSGPTTSVGSANARAPLAVWLLLAAFVPLGFLLRRRNF